jgi:hypothetical protein
LSIRSEVTARVQSLVLDNPEIHCRIWDETGNYQILLVQADQTRLAVTYDNLGNMTASLLDASGEAIWTGETARNAHGRDAWADVGLLLDGDHLQVYANGTLRLDENLPQALSGLTLELQTEVGGVIRVDDCVILGDGS